VLALDDDELRAATSLLSGIAPGHDSAASVAVGSVRLRARGLLTGSRLEANAAALLEIYMRPNDSLATAIRRKSSEAAELNLTFHRQGEHVVEHYRVVVGDGEWHSFDGLPGTKQVVERLVLLLQPTASESGEVSVLDLAGLEHARLAAASADRLAAQTALRSAGADAALTDGLAAALLEAHTFAQLVHLCPGETQPRDSLNVLVAPDGVWTFVQAGGEVRVACVSDAGLRQRLRDVWAT
jgi:hypothetical protein